MLELTETAMIDDAEASIEMMKSIRNLGVLLHLDDFGTGYSSLSTLHQFPLSGIKIDRSFITRLGEEHHFTAVVNAIVSLSKHLGIKLIAEGIENHQQIHILQGMECDLAQGFYFSKARRCADRGTVDSNTDDADAGGVMLTSARQRFGQDAAALKR